MRTARHLRPIFVALLLFLCVALPARSVTAATKPAAKDATKTSSKTAASPPQNISNAIIQSYSATAAIQQGIIVKVKDKAAGTVEPLKSAEGMKMLGVVVTPSAATVTLTPEAAKMQQIFVATSGRYDVLVTNQDGVIVPGDYIVVSALTGLGMKADENQSLVLGKAVSGFNGTKQVVGSTKLKDQTGKELSVSIGRITVDINIAHNPLQQKATDFLPAFLAKAATTVAQKPISVARIYLGLAIVVVSGFITANTVYSGIRGGMMAVGRNPLSKKSIIKSLIQTVLAGLIIFIAGIFAVYLLLKL
jgi:hypothetical protein